MTRVLDSGDLLNTTRVYLTLCYTPDFDPHVAAETRKAKDSFRRCNVTMKIPRTI